MSDRKYQQRGYRESGARPLVERREPAAAPPPSDRRELPRGRGLGAPTEMIFRCARCGGESAIAGAVTFESRCPGCGADLHACANCTGFDPSARFECRRELTARVAPKDRANRCELFEPRTRQEFAQEKAKPAEARSAFDALFKS